MNSHRRVYLPVMSSVVEVVADDGPDDLLSGLGITIVNQPLGILRHGDGPERRTIVLGSACSKLDSISKLRSEIKLTPSTSELGQVNVEFSFSKTASINKATRRIVHTLELRLGHNILLDLLLQRSIVISGSELLNHRLEDKGTVASPGIPVFEH